jgi:hypothetical protein
MVDREGKQVDGGEPGVEAPLLDPIDFVPTPGAVAKGAVVIGKIGLKAFGKFTAKKAGAGLLNVAPRALPILRGTSIAVFKRGAEGEAKAAAAVAAAKAAAKAATGQVAYGSTDLAQKAIAFRIAKQITTARNIAVFEYVEGGVVKTVEMASERGVGHSERLIAKQLERKAVDPKTVTRIYSELEPCVSYGGYCKTFIGKTFPNALVSHSFEYGATEESRRAGVEALRNAVAALFKK